MVMREPFSELGDLTRNDPMNIKAKSYIVCLSTYNAKLTTKICRSSNQKGILSLGKKLGLKWSLISLSIIGLCRPKDLAYPLDLYQP